MLAWTTLCLTKATKNKDDGVEAAAPNREQREHAVLWPVLDCPVSACSAWMTSNSNHVYPPALGGRLGPCAHYQVVTICNEVSEEEESKEERLRFGPSCLPKNRRQAQTLLGQLAACYLYQSHTMFQA